MVRWGQDSIQLLSAESDGSDSSSESTTAKPSTTVRRPRFYRARPVTNTTHPFLVKEHVGTILSLACIIILLVWIILLTIVSTKLYKKVFEVQELTNRICA